MKTRLLALVGALALVLVASACSTVSPSAATVNGTRLDRREFQDLLRTYADNTLYTSAASQQGVAVQGAQDGGVSIRFATSVLTDEIFLTLVGDEVARLGLEVTSGARELARDVFAVPFLRGQAAFDAFPTWFQDRMIDRIAAWVTLQAHFAGIGDPKEAIDAALAEDPAQFESRCLSHILVDNEDEAREIVGLLAGGADFATLAEERSIDPGSAAQGGTLGCSTKTETTARYVPEFATAANAAEVGRPTAPVKSDFGYHIILVTSTEPSPNGALQAVLQPGEAAYREWLTGAFSTARITVDPRYGTWDEQNALIVPPAGATAG